MWHDTRVTTFFFYVYKYFLLLCDWGFMTFTFVHVIPSRRAQFFFIPFYSFSYSHGFIKEYLFVISLHWGEGGS